LSRNSKAETVPLGVSPPSLAESLTNLNPLKMSTALVVATTSDAYSRPVVAATRAGLRDDVSVIEVSAHECLGLSWIMAHPRGVYNGVVATLTATIFLPLHVCTLGFHPSHHPLSTAIAEALHSDGVHPLTWG
jgi:hypothetical protein